MSDHMLKFNQGTLTAMRGEANAAVLLGQRLPDGFTEIEHTFLGVQHDLKINPDALPERTHATYMAKFQHDRWVEVHSQLADELFGSLENRPERLVALSPYDEYRVRALRKRLVIIPAATRREFAMKMRVVR